VVKAKQFDADSFATKELIYLKNITQDYKKGQCVCNIGRST
jgi:hypothetical protein